MIEAERKLLAVTQRSVVIPGRFYVVCGADGVGKSSVIREMQRIDNSIIYTKEPWDESIIELIKQAKHPVEMSALFLADRYKHVRFVEAQLSAGRDVVTDRYWMSDVVYRRYDANHDLILHEEVDAIWNLQPDIMVDKLFYLYCEPEIASKRCSKKRQDSLGSTGESVDKLRELMEIYEEEIITDYEYDTGKMSSKEVARSIVEIIKAERKL